MIEPSKNKSETDGVAADTTSFDPNGPIRRKLKSFYDVIETEDVPDRLLELLEKLDEAERKATGGS